MFSSLDRHLRAPEEHDGLPFHAQCPVCQQRALGALPSGGLVTRQTQAALAAGVLAVSAASPTGALARPPVDQAPNAAAPAPLPATPAPLEDPTLDPDWQSPGPEGESGEEAPQQAPPSSDDGLGGGEDETGAVESEPLADSTPDPQEFEEPPPAPTPAPTAPVAPQPVPVEVPAPVPVPETSLALPAPPAAVDEDSSSAPPVAHAKERPLIEKRTPARELIRRAAPVPAPAPAAPSLAAAPAVQGERATVAAAAPPAAAQAVSAQDAAVKGARYKIRAGDSLWSIAKRQLGPEASAGQIAGQVHRLWTLNAERIATGDPDLLAVGTLLHLR